MTSRIVGSTYIGAVMGVLASLAAAQPGVSGVMRTAWGDPDLQGVWNHGTITPLERPVEYAGRERLTDEEVAALNRASETRATSGRRSSLTAQQDVALAYNQFWWDRGISTGRTSLLTDPSDGRLPLRTTQAEALADTPEGQRVRLARRGNAPAHGPEDMDLGDRCLVYRPVPITSSGYNNHVHILQSPGYVVIAQEQIHDVRVIPVGDHPQLPEHVRQWLGVSRGRWEGETLVVETANFYHQADYLGSSIGRHVVERLTRVADDAIHYEFTVDDPSVWVRPWTGMVPWRPADGPLFEYACHEGNYGMTNLLTSSRAVDREAALSGQGDEALRDDAPTVADAGDERSVLDGVFTASQSLRGAREFSRTCSSCHSSAEFSGGRFRIRWVGETVGDLFITVSTLMPEANPGSLSQEAYASLVAYLLDLNGYPTGEGQLPSDPVVLSGLEIVANPR